MIEDRYEQETRDHEATVNNTAEKHPRPVMTVSHRRGAVKQH